MTLIFVILIVIASAVLGLVVLIQNPKGGGLAGNIAGFSTQFMGVKQTTDVLEKGTWIFAGAIAVLSLASTLFIGKPAVNSNNSTPSQQQQQQPQQQPTNNSNTVPLNSGQ
jgi:preprotein translocase subunit SecG